MVGAARQGSAVIYTEVRMLARADHIDQERRTFALMAVAERYGLRLPCAEPTKRYSDEAYVETVLPSSISADSCSDSQGLQPKAACYNGFRSENVSYE